MIYQPPGHGLYNTTIVVLKFLLAPLAICVLVFVQLEIRFPAAFALVDATPTIQTSRDGEFHAAFYALRIFASYKTLRVQAAVRTPGGQDLSLGSQTFTKLTPPFYSYDLKLPKEATPGHYEFRYQVFFDERPEATPFSRKAPAGRPHMVDFNSDCVDTLTEPYTVFIRQGQQVRLPKEWEPMGLAPLDGGRIATIRTHGGAPWITANAAPGDYRVRLRSTLTVSGIDMSTNRITTDGGGGRVLVYDAQTRRLRRCSYRVEPAVGDRIAFVLRPDGKTAVLLATPFSKDDTTWDMEVHMIVAANQPPRSTDFYGHPNEARLYTSWLFFDATSRRYYFRLSLYVIDPDGQDKVTGDPDIRVDMNLPQSGRRLYSLEGDKLYLTTAGENVFQNLPLGASEQVTLEVRDELPRPPMTLSIQKNQ